MKSTCCITPASDGVPSQGHEPGGGLDARSRTLGHPSFEPCALSLHNLEKQGKSAPRIPFGGMEMGRRGRKVENRGPQTSREFRSTPLLSPERMCPDFRPDHRMGRTGRGAAVGRQAGSGRAEARTQKASVGSHMRPRANMGAVNKRRASCSLTSVAT